MWNVRDVLLLVTPALCSVDILLTAFVFIKQQELKEECTELVKSIKDEVRRMYQPIPDSMWSVSTQHGSLEYSLEDNVEVISPSGTPITLSNHS